MVKKVAQMFNKKKVKPIAPAVKNPPRVVKETKSYRFVVYQQVASMDPDTQVVLSYTDCLVMQVRNVNAMEEPFWKDDTTLYYVHPAHMSSYSHEVENNKLNAVVRELLGIE